MPVIAHIAGIPVQEWAPFVVPVVAVYLFVRRKERRRRQAVQRLPDPGQPLDDEVVERVIAAWSAADHNNVSREHLPLLYPPGPDGMSAAELADRVHADPARVRWLLEQLEEFEYLDLEERHDDGPRAWATFKGYELLETTETALLAALAHDGHRPVDAIAKAEV